LWVNARQVWAFVQIAVNASEGQVVQNVRSAVGLWNNVLDMERSEWRVVLVQLTVLAAICGTFPDASLRALVHPFSGS
jgi:hypothetical protein